MTKQIAKKITAKAAAEILEKVPHERDAEYESIIGDQIAYALADGRLLVVAEEGRHWLWPSRDECVSSLNRTRNSAPDHTLTGTFTAGPDFPARAGSQDVTLARRLKIPPAALDKSLASLSQVDEALHKYGARKALKPAVFEPLVAYVGEVIRSIVDGKWEMRLYDDGKTWEPWIVDDNGSEYAPFLVVYKELDSDEGYSIRGAVEGEIGSRRRAGG